MKSTNLTLAEEISLFRLQATQGNIWTSFTPQFQGRTDNALKNRWFGGVRRVARVLNVDFNEASQILALFATTAGPSPIPLETYALSHSGDRVSFEEPIVALGTFLTSGSGKGPTPQLATLLPDEVDTLIRAAVHRVGRTRTSSPASSRSAATTTTNRSVKVATTTTTTTAALKRPVSAIITPTSTPVAPRNQRSACWVTRDGQEVNDMNEDVPQPPPLPSARIHTQQHQQQQQQQQQQQRYAAPTPTPSSEYVPVGLSYTIDGKLTPATPRGAELCASLAKFAASCGAPAVVYWVPRTLVEGALAHSEEERNGEGEEEENHAAGGGQIVDEEEVDKEVKEEAGENGIETSPIMIGTTPVADVLDISPIMMIGTTPTPTPTPVADIPVLPSTPPSLT